MTGCKHGNTKIINVEFKDKTEKRFFPCYCKVEESMVTCKICRIDFPVRIFYIHLKTVHMDDLIELGVRYLTKKRDVA